MARNRPGNDRLHEDARHARELAQALRERQERHAGDNRVLAVLSAGGNADQFYRPALDRLAGQATESGTRLQIVLGLNNGAEFPAGWAPGRTDVTHLYADDKAAANQPAVIHSTPERAGRFVLHEPAADKHELYAVHQPAGPNAAGKIRMLSDLYHMLLQSIAYGGKLPKRMLLLDAESHFHRVTGSPDRAPDQSTNGLEALLAHLEGPEAVRMVGATMRHTAYRLVQPGMERVPDFGVRISALHRALNATHGHHRHQSLIGGGIAGSTPELLALGSTVAKYPGLRSEDAAMSLLADHAGVAKKVATDALVTNFTPPAAEYERVVDQLSRWGLGPAAVRELYGTNEYGDLSHIEKLKSLLADVAYLLRSGTFFGVVRDKLAVRKRVKQLPPESPLEGTAGWAAN